MAARRREPGNYRLASVAAQDQVERIGLTDRDPHVLPVDMRAKQLARGGVGIGDHPAIDQQDRNADTVEQAGIGMGHGQVS